MGGGGDDKLREPSTSTRTRYLPRAVPTHCVLHPARTARRRSAWLGLDAASKSLDAMVKAGATTKAQNATIAIHALPGTPEGQQRACPDRGQEFRADAPSPGRRL